MRLGRITRRKIQLTGGSTYILSLPKEWAKTVGLTHGSEVSIDILPDYTLRVIPPYIKEKVIEKVKKIEISPESMDLGKLESISAYLAGYNTIRIEYKDGDFNSLRKMIEFTKNKAIGLEVLDEEANEITLYSVINTSALTMDKAIDKMMHTTRSMLEDVEKNMVHPDKEILKSIIERDNVVDKLFLLIMRQLNHLLLGELSPSQIGLKVMPELLYVVLSVKSIERIADHAVLISEKLLRTSNKIMITDEIVGMFTKTKEAFINAIKGFKTKNKKYTINVLSLIKELEKEEEKIRQNTVNLTAFPDIHLILDSIRRIRAYSLDIIESTINIITIRELLQS